MSSFTDTGFPFVCDFCGASSNNVFRTVMDDGYNRMQAKAMYACLSCSVEKDNERRKNGLS